MRVLISRVQLCLMASETKSVCAIKKVGGNISAPHSYVKVLYVHAHANYMHIFCAAGKGIAKDAAQKHRQIKYAFFRGTQCNHTDICNWLFVGCNWFIHLLALRFEIQQQFIKSEFKIKSKYTFWNHPSPPVNEGCVIWLKLRLQLTITSMINPLLHVCK